MSLQKEMKARGDTGSMGRLGCIQRRSLSNEGRGRGRDNDVSESGEMKM